MTTALTQVMQVMQAMFSLEWGKLAGERNDSFHPPCRKHCFIACITCTPHHPRAKAGPMPLHASPHPHAATTDRGREKGGTRPATGTPSCVATTALSTLAPARHPPTNPKPFDTELFDIE